MDLAQMSLYVCTYQKNFLKSFLTNNELGIN